VEWTKALCGEDADCDADDEGGYVNGGLVVMMMVGGW